MMPADYLGQVFTRIAGRQGRLPGARMPAPLFFQTWIDSFKLWRYITRCLIDNFFLKSRGDFTYIMSAGGAGGSCLEKLFTQRLRIKVYQRLRDFTYYTGMFKNISARGHGALRRCISFSQAAF